MRLNLEYPEFFTCTEGIARKGSKIANGLRKKIPAGFMAPWIDQLTGLKYEEYVNFYEVSSEQYTYLTNVLGVEQFIVPRKIEIADQSPSIFRDKFVLIVESDLSLVEQELLQKILTACKWPEDFLSFCGQSINREAVSFENCMIFCFGRESFPDFELGLQSFAGNSLLLADKFSEYLDAQSKKKQLWHLMQQFMQNFSGSKS